MSATNKTRSNRYDRQQQPRPFHSLRRPKRELLEEGSYESMLEVPDVIYGIHTIGGCGKNTIFKIAKKVSPQKSALSDCYFFLAEFVQAFTTKYIFDLYFQYPCFSRELSLPRPRCVHFMGNHTCFFKKKFFLFPL